MVFGSLALVYILPLATHLYSCLQADNVYIRGVGSNSVINDIFKN